MSKVELIILLYIIMGFLLASGGFLLAYNFNFNSYIPSFPLRVAGIIGGSILLFIGIHIVMVGAISLISLKRKL